MYPGIELRLYRYVSVLAEELNFTQAAQRLNVSQPTLSTQIRDLEREIDVKLFARTRGGQQVVLTASGQAFATEARLALVHADRAIQEARAVEGLHAGTWNLGYSPLVDLRIVSRVRRYLEEAYPSVNSRIVSGHSAEHVEALIAGRLHAGLIISTAEEQRIARDFVHRERLLLALPRQHALAAKKNIEITDLHDLPLIKIRGDIEPRFGESLKRFLALIRIKPRIYHEATTQGEALQIVAQDGVAALTTEAAEQLANDYVLFRHFVQELLFVHTSLAYFGEPVSPILTSVRKFLSDTYQPLEPASLVREPKTHQMILFTPNPLIQGT